MYRNLKKNILILGASSDIGLRVVEYFLSKDWFIYAHYNNNLKSLKDLKYSKKNLKLLKLNFNNQKQINRFCKFLSNENVSSCVNLVGYLDNISFKNSNLESLIKSLKINTLIPLFIQRALIPRMIKNKFGRFLNVSSIGVKYGGSEFTFNHSFSKHALEYIPSYFKNLAKKNIFINTLRIGVVNTKLLKSIKGKNIKKRVKLIPIRRMAEPKEMSKIIYDLTSEQNTYITGEKITIAGGE